MLHIYIDGDACPLKEETYRVAARYGLRVTVVANKAMRIPEEGVELVVVSEGLDVADDWIAARAGRGDIVITADVPLAARCIARGASVIGTTGRPFTEDNIGEAVATRDLFAEMREAGGTIGGPPPFQKKHRSTFLQTLDATVSRILRERDNSAY